MANATDNLYINVLANVKGALDPLKKLASTIQTVMNLGGVAILVKQVAQAMGEMEKAYAKLHPESQKAVGSLANWNRAMENLKADQGAVVSKILNPIRAAFLELIDPIGQATFELKALNDELNNTYNKYLSSASKKVLELRDAQAALTKAVADSKKASEDLYLAQKARTALMANAPTAQMRMLAGQRGGEAIAEKIRQYDEQLAKYNERIAALQDILFVSGMLIQELPNWIKEHGEAAKAADPALVNYNSVATETVDIMGDYQAQLEAATEWMDSLRSGTKSAAEETEKLGRAMVNVGRKVQTGKGGTGGAAQHRSVGRRDSPKGQADEVRDLTAEWQRYAEVMSIVATSMGEAFATGDYIEGLRQMTQGLLNFIAKEAIAAALRIITEQGTAGIPLAAGLLALGGVAMVGSAAMSAGGGGGGGSGIERPRMMASGGIVTRPTLAMIGEAGPEAVVPLGRGGGGGTTIIVQGSIWQTEDLARAVADRMGKW